MSGWWPKDANLNFAFEFCWVGCLWDGIIDKDVLAVNFNVLGVS